MKGVLPILMISVGLTLAWPMNAQKKEMDHDVYDSWQKVSTLKLSDDGNVQVWQVDPQEGDGTLYIRKTSSQKKKSKGQQVSEISIPRGYGFSMDPKGQWLVCKIKPEFAKNRQERIDKKKKEEMTQDSLVLVDLAKMEIKRYGVCESISAQAKSLNHFIYKSYWQEFKDSTDKKGKIVNGQIVLNPATNHADTLKNIGKIKFSEDGNFIAMTTTKDSKDTTTLNSIIVVSYPFEDANKIQIDTIARDAESYSALAFSDDASLLGFTCTTDKNKTGGKRYSMSLASKEVSSTKGKPCTWSVKEIIPQGTYAEGTDNWTLTDMSDLYFSSDNKRIFTGVAAIKPPKDSTLVDFETAQLDIWSWDAPYTPPQQKIERNRIVNKTYFSVINLGENNKILPLTKEYFDSIILLNGGLSDYAISRDNSKYVRSSVWDYYSKSDFSLVNLNDGSRKTIANEIDGRGDISPEGKYLLWFDNGDLNWHTYNIETGATVNLTEKTGVVFYDELNDKPTAPECHERSPQWIEGDAAVLIIDRYDVWKFAPDGSSAINLTKGVGRQTKNRFRTIGPMRESLSENMRKCGVRQSLGAKENINLSVLNEETKENGFGIMNVAKAAEPQYFTDTVSFMLMTRTLKSNRIGFLKGNYRHCYDFYTTDDFFKSDEKLSAINPQMNDYRWGHVEMMTWNAYDGKPLKGLVFIPDGIKPGEKLPVMIYFYEKYSDQLYNAWTPAPSRSTVNIPFFTSRGYICFIPDIVYEVGHPGESAYNCICSGAEALCEKYSFADKSKMGIQGQSWGGYQTAYLVTRTDMFAAAGSGAPVGNMTSAYGGIRWGSGITRAGQYEHGQSRIGVSMWEKGALDLYIENSPVFHANKVHTPILIMHNDSDGAVPWYQGIEFFSDLRRLDRPAWLLEYNNEEHNLLQRRNCKDLSKRLQQFFDYYLKGAPQPAWMKYGVPTDRKAEYFGFENAE